jgi:hypothetical protein
MPAVNSSSTFYVPLTEEPPRYEDESLYASIDDPSGYEPPTQRSRNDYGRLHVEEAEPTQNAYGMSSWTPLLPNRSEGVYEEIGPRFMSPPAKPPRTFTYVREGDADRVRPARTREPVYAELEGPPPVAPKPAFLLAGDAARERRGH